ncbi:MAG: hypothetical protein ABW352_19670, partial [Polyangiales bacterium]
PACTAWTVTCTAPTQYVATPRSSTSDRVCGTCPMGSETSADNQAGMGACTPVMIDAGMMPDPDAGAGDAGM